MASNLPPVPHRIPMLDPSGRTHPAWLDWFQKVFVRVGGTEAETNDELKLDLDPIETVTTDRLLGRDTGGTGLVEELSVSGGIEFTGSGGIRTGAFTGDVTKTAGGTALTIGNGAVNFAKLLGTDWTAVTTASGYQKLGSGVYIQWGVTASIASATTSTITFPIAFPTACRQVITGIQGNSAVATTTTGHHGTGNYTTTGFDLYNRTSSAYVFNYIAVGV